MTRRGDVVIVDFPFTDGGSKVRPALVVQNDQGSKGTLRHSRALGLSPGMGVRYTSRTVTGSRRANHAVHPGSSPSVLRPPVATKLPANRRPGNGWAVSAPTA